MEGKTTYRPEPGKVVVVGSIPACNFCQDGTPGPFDFKTTFGPWANGCEVHWKEHRASATLGVGQGQRWITEDQVALTWREIQDILDAAPSNRAEWTPVQRRAHQATLDFAKRLNGDAS